jgi:hypothetical protein
LVAWSAQAARARTATRETAADLVMGSSRCRWASGHSGLGEDISGWRQDLYDE